MTNKKKTVKKKQVKVEENPNIDTKHWYSPIYKMHNVGFFVTQHGNQCYLGFKENDDKGKCIRSLEVNVSYDTFKVLKKEWELR